MGLRAIGLPVRCGEPIPQLRHPKTLLTRRKRPADVMSQNPVSEDWLQPWTQLSFCGENGTGTRSQVAHELGCASSKGEVGLAFPQCVWLKSGKSE